VNGIGREERKGKGGREGEGRGNRGGRRRKGRDGKGDGLTVMKNTYFRPWTRTDLVTDPNPIRTSRAVNMTNRPGSEMH